MEKARRGGSRREGSRQIQPWKRGVLLLSILFVGFVAGCGDPYDYHDYCPTYSVRDYMNPFLLIHYDHVSIEQGVWGNVLFWEGDFMPGGTTHRSITPVIREIHFFEAATEADVGPVAPYDTFYYDVFTPIVAVTTSDACGFFEVALDPGTYSAFVLEGDLYYGPLLANDGTIMKVTVPEAGGPVNFRMDIDYLAYY